MYAKLNGGLYTGEPFEEGAPWATVPVIPDAAYMTHQNLRSANPPVQALVQYPGGPRPGNNEQTMPGVTQSANSAIWCNNMTCDHDLITGYSTGTIFGSAKST
jgi:hypothetical protein